MAASNKGPGNTVIQGYLKGAASGLAAISLVFLFSCGKDDRLMQPGAGMAGGYPGMGGGYPGMGGNYPGTMPGVAGSGVTSGNTGAPIVGTGGAGTSGTVIGGAGTGAPGSGGGTEQVGTCGNNIVDPGEECDGDQLNGETCQSLGHQGGILGCDDQCHYDVVMCTDDGGNPGYGADGGSRPDSSINTDHCLAGITNYDSAGPFTFQTTRSGAINMWVPNVPPGCKVPMVHLANGTGATCGIYGPSLERLASHGFFALCYESTQTGAGTQGIEAFETALAQYPDLADLKFGSTGHSQGGQSSFVVLQFAEEKWGTQGVYAGLAMQPASGFGAQPATGTWQQVYSRIVSPMFMFSGAGTDGLVSQSWVQSGFDALSDTVEAYHWAKTGGTHIPVPNGEEMQISIPWFRWKLLGDQQACQAFKAIRNDPTWTEAAVQNEQPCM